MPAQSRDEHAAGRPARKRKIVVEDLLKLQFVLDPQISPDGEALLFCKKHVGEKNDYVTNLWIATADGASTRQFTSGNKDQHGRWSPDGSKVAFISRRNNARPNIYTISAAGGESTQLTRFPEGTIKTFRWSPDGTMLAVSFRESEADWTEEARQQRKQDGRSAPPRVIDDVYYRLDGEGYFNKNRYSLYIVDVSTGDHRLLYDRDTMGWFRFDWSPDSTELVVSANTSRDAPLKQWKTELYRVNVNSGRARKIPNLPSGAKSVVCWSPDGTRIAYAGREGKDVWGVQNTRLYVCDPQRGEATILTADEDYCLAASTVSDTDEPAFEPSFCWGRDGKRIFMNFGWQGESHVVSIDADGGSCVFLTEGRRTVSMGNLSRDGKRMALSVSDQVSPAEAAVGRLQTPSKPGSMRVERVTCFNQDLLDELELSEAEPHWIDTESGSKVHAWVMRPVGFKLRKRSPAVIQVHGGPHCQYGETFFFEFQLLAATGYVVVYSNPRGSKGYGEEHCLAIKGNWGAADWEDLQAVAEFTRSLPIVRANRIGIAGGSYGGYMTNWAIGHSDQFAAAVSDRCVSNLVSMVGTSDVPLMDGDYFEGIPWDNPEPLWDQSPLKYFGSVKTPTLIIHSEGDLRCSIGQAEQLFMALKARGIPARFVRYPLSTSHGMSRSGPPDLRIHRLQQQLQWWKEYLG